MMLSSLMVSLHHCDQTRLELVVSPFGGSRAAPGHGFSASSVTVTGRGRAGHCPSARMPKGQTQHTKRGLTDSVGAHATFSVGLRF